MGEDRGDGDEGSAARAREQGREEEGCEVVVGKCVCVECSMGRQWLAEWGDYGR